MSFRQCMNIMELEANFGDNIMLLFIFLARLCIQHERAVQSACRPGTREKNGRGLEAAARFRETQERDRGERR